MTNSNPNEGMSPRLRQDFFDRLNKSRKTFLWCGVAFGLLGIVALLFPMISTLASVTIIGWMLAFGGALVLIGSFSYRGTGSFFGSLLLGLLNLAAGVYMVVNPEITAIVLTLVIACIFIVDGAFIISTAFEVKPLDGWGWLLISGIVSALAGLFTLGSLHGVSLILLGILIGVNFLSTGIAMVMVSRKLPTNP